MATTVGCPGLAKSAVALAWGAKVPFAWTISGPWVIGATASCPADATRLAAAAAAWADLESLAELPAVTFKFCFEDVAGTEVAAAYCEAYFCCYWESDETMLRSCSSWS